MYSQQSLPRTSDCVDWQINRRSKGSCCWDGYAGSDGCPVHEPCQPCMRLAWWDLRARLQGIRDSGTWKTSVERGIRVLHFGCASWTYQSPVRGQQWDRGSAVPPFVSWVGIHAEHVSSGRFAGGHDDAWRCFQDEATHVPHLSCFRADHFSSPKQQMFPHPGEWSMLATASVFVAFLPFWFLTRQTFLPWNFVWCRRIWKTWRVWTGVSLLPTFSTMLSKTRCTRRVVVCT